MVEPTSEEEFEEKLSTLIATKILRLEEVDFPFLVDSVNDLLTQLTNYRAKTCTLQSLFLDMTFYLKLRTDPMFYGATIEEARTIFLQGLTFYFTDPQSVRDRFLHLAKLDRLEKLKLKGE